MTLEPQKFTWAPYAHFRLPTRGRHAHHETGTAPWVNDCRVQMCIWLDSQAVYHFTNFGILPQTSFFIPAFEAYPRQVPDIVFDLHSVH